MPCWLEESSNIACSSMPAVNDYTACLEMETLDQRRLVNLKVWTDQHVLPGICI